MSEDLSFLEEDEPTRAPDAQPPEIAPAPQAEQPPEPTPNAAEPVTPINEPQPDPAGPPVVPIGVMHAERDRRLAVEQELTRLRAAQQPPAVPDPYEDPAGYQQYQAAHTEQIALNVKLDLSEDMARERHGDEIVDKARDWALARMNTSPAFRAEVLGQRNPYGYAVQQYQREQALEELKDPAEFAAFRAWKAAQTAPGQPQPAAIAAPPQRTAPTPPPRSLASAPSAGGVQTQVVEDPFEAEFPKR